MREAAGATRNTELRLALVCYGGVSLAVYMHGITKELHKLVKASRAFDAVDVEAPNPFSPTPTDSSDSEHAYFEALRDLARNGRRLSVAVDVISGTSAGGINGVVLGKAIARGGSQDGLKKLWIDEGDLRTLLRAPGFAGLKVQALLAALRTVAMPFSTSSPLRGERMSQLLMQALGAMDTDAADRGLVPPNGTLDLFVTATDLHGFEVLVPAGPGGASQRDRFYAQVLEFRHPNDDGTSFTGADTPVLSFAARATASFPGAFAPVSIESFGRELAEKRGLLRRLKDRTTGSVVDLARIPTHFRYRYDEHGERAEHAWLVDGGVLDNAPFDLTVEAIARKRAETEVVRRLVYLQPDPGRALGEPPQTPATERSKAPGWLPGLFRAVTTVKGSHPVLRELFAIRDLNLRVAEIGAITSSQMDLVVQRIDEAMGATSVAEDGTEWRVDDKEAVKRVADEMYRQARTFVGAGFPTYCRLKVEAAGRRLADEVAERFVYPYDSSRSSFVRAAIAAWARGQDEWRQPDPEQLLRLLGPVDVPYRERRLLFILAGVNVFYGRLDQGDDGPPREDLDALKTAAWDLLEQLRRIPGEVVRDVRAEDVAFLAPESVDAARFGSPDAFATKHDSDFRALFTSYRAAMADKLGDGSTPLWLEFERRTASWSAADRKTLLARFLGFPLWDSLIFPTIALSQLPQFTPIGVAQFSPLTARALETPPEGKLRGVTLHHFGAFLDAAWRENDYLWGRLDAAELILRMLRDASPPVDSDVDVDDALEPMSRDEAIRRAGADHLKRALSAIVTAESGLKRVGDLRARLEAEIARLPGSVDRSLASTDKSGDLPASIDLTPSREPTRSD